MNIAESDLWLVLCDTNSVFHIQQFSHRRGEGGVHPINRDRDLYGEYHTLLPELRRDCERFYDCLRMTPETFDQRQPEMGNQVNIKRLHF